MVKIFLFHRINPERDILWDPVDVSLFDKCVKYISSSSEVVLLEDLFLANFGLNQTKNYSAIAFDDGYKDNIDYALPILTKHGVKASFYVVTDCIDRNIPTWTYIIDYSFHYTTKHKIDLDFEFLPEELRIKNLYNADKRIAFVKKLKPALKRISHEDRSKVIAVVRESFDDVRLPQLMMSWEELRQLRSEGHYIGSHTVTHSMLGSMTNEDEVARELTQSGAKIKHHLGYFPMTISYPVGSYNAATIRLSWASGYRIGLAVKQRPFYPTKDSRFEIPRIEIYNEPWIKTRLRIDNVVGTISRFLKRV